MTNHKLIPYPFSRGCVIYYSPGHDYVRSMLRAIVGELGTLVAEHPAEFPGVGMKMLFDAGAVWQSLNGPMPDDAWDEDEALDFLNATAPADCVWVMDEERGGVFLNKREGD